MRLTIAGEGEYIQARRAGSTACGYEVYGGPILLVKSKGGGVRSAHVGCSHDGRGEKGNITRLVCSV